MILPNYPNTQPNVPPPFPNQPVKYDELKPFTSKYDNIITEDDEPVDNIFSEKQQRLLTDSLYNGWQQPNFQTYANVGLFYDLHKPPLVPDVMVSLDVKMPPNVWEKHNRSYFVEEYGKPPEVAIEIVSNLKGKEDGTKLIDYADAGVIYYVIFDPLDQLQEGILRLYELQGSIYTQTTDLWLSKLGIGFSLWKGKYEGRQETWLRWCDQNGKLILTGAESMKREQLAKDKAKKRVKQERLEKENAQMRAEQERLEKEQERLEKENAQKLAEKLAAQLKALGIEPEL